MFQIVYFTPYGTTDKICFGKAWENGTGFEVLISEKKDIKMLLKHFPSLDMYRLYTDVFGEVSYTDSFNGFDTTFYAKVVMLWKVNDQIHVTFNPVENNIEIMECIAKSQ